MHSVRPLATIKDIDHLSFSDYRIRWIIYFHRFDIYVEYVVYLEDKETSKKAASTIENKYSSYPEKNRIYFFWTNGTLDRAKKVQKHLASNLGQEKVILLETTVQGMEMEKNVDDDLSDSLRELGYDDDSIVSMKQDRELWGELFDKNVEMIEKHSKSCRNQKFKKSNKQHILKKIAKLKDKLNKYQEKTSVQYARKADARCFIMKFRRQGEKAGYNSQAEDNVLDELGLKFNGFVAIADKEREMKNRKG